MFSVQFHGASNSNISGKGIDAQSIQREFKGRSVSRTPAISLKTVAVAALMFSGGVLAWADTSVQKPANALWVNPNRDLPQTSGCFVLDDTWLYEGELENEMPHGYGEKSDRGCTTFKSGLWKKGELKQGIVKEYPGSEYCTPKKDVSQRVQTESFWGVRMRKGSFENDRLNGRGIVQHVYLKSLLKNTKIGNFKNDVLDGRGIDELTYPSGERHMRRGHYIEGTAVGFFIEKKIASNGTTTMIKKTAFIDEMVSGGRLLVIPGKEESEFCLRYYDQDVACGSWVKMKVLQAISSISVELSTWIAISIILSLACTINFHRNRV